jgi:hypothetical protein
VIYLVVAQFLIVWQGLSLGHPDLGPEIKEAVVDNPKKEKNETHMEKNHPKRNNRELPPPYPAEKAARYIDYQKHQQ